MPFWIGMATRMKTMVTREYRRTVHHLLSGPAMVDRYASRCSDRVNPAMTAISTSIPSLPFLATSAPRSPNSMPMTIRRGPEAKFSMSECQNLLTSTMPRLQKMTAASAMMTASRALSLKNTRSTPPTPATLALNHCLLDFLRASSSSFTAVVTTETGPWSGPLGGAVVGNAVVEGASVASLHSSACGGPSASEGATAAAASASASARER
mmetsp:Transcript_60798/g.157713  ORF Transcript_60798/g.157713 Transcript_60798/m.157713 type:complete len:210 (-) Transcript_60798:66-695(-)